MNTETGNNNSNNNNSQTAHSAASSLSPLGPRHPLPTRAQLATMTDDELLALWGGLSGFMRHFGLNPDDAEDRAEARILVDAVRESCGSGPRQFFWGGR